MSNASIAQPLRNARSNSSASSRTSRTKSPAPARLAITLALSLCCAACAHRPALAPAIAQTARGNAVLMTLPAGTQLQFPDANSHELARAVFVNEVEAKPGRALQVRSPLRLATPAYIDDRDARELALIEQIERMKLSR